MEGEEEAPPAGAVNSSPQNNSKRKEPPSPCSSDDEEDLLEKYPETARLNFRMDPEESHSDWKIVIVVDGGSKEETYHVHKVSLSVGMKRCMYFRRLFQNKRLKEHETCTSRIELHELAAKAFPVMLDYLYSPSNEFDINAGNSVPLYHLAEFFDCPLLRSKVRLYWKNVLQVDDLATCYGHCKFFPDEKAYQAIVSEICNHTPSIESDSELMKISDEKLWRDVMVKKNGEVDTRLSLLIAEFCSDHKDRLSMEVFLQLVEESLLPVLDPDAAIELMEIEQGLRDAAAHECCADEFTSLQKRGVEALASANFDNALLTKKNLSPSVVSRVVMRSLDLAQKELKNLRSLEGGLPKSVRVKGAGLEEVNGLYERRSEYGRGSLHFSKKGTWRGDSATFYLLANTFPGIAVWSIAVADPDDNQPRAIPYMRLMQSPKNDGILMPPVEGWRAGQLDDAEPAPQLVYRFGIGQD